MTQPYPEPPDDYMTETEARFLTAKVVPYHEAEEGDRVFALIGAIDSAAYSSKGAFILKLEIPFDIVGDPTDLMRSQGRHLMIEGFKIA